MIWLPGPFLSTIFRFRNKNNLKEILKHKKIFQPFTHKKPAVPSCNSNLRGPCFCCSSKTLEQSSNSCWGVYINACFKVLPKKTTFLTRLLMHSRDAASLPFISPHFLVILFNEMFVMCFVSAVIRLPKAHES